MTKCLPFDAETPIRKAAGHIAIEVDGQVMLMSESHSRYLGLDLIGSDIWRRLEQPQTLCELCASLAQEYAAAPGAIQWDVANLLTSLHGYGLLETERAIAPSTVTANAPSSAATQRTAPLRSRLGK